MEKAPTKAASKKSVKKTAPKAKELTEAEKLAVTVETPTPQAVAPKGKKAKAEPLSWMKANAALEPTIFRQLPKFAQLLTLLGRVKNGKFTWTMLEGQIAEFYEVSVERLQIDEAPRLRTIKAYLNNLAKSGQSVIKDSTMRPYAFLIERDTAGYRFAGEQPTVSKELIRDGAAAAISKVLAKQEAANA